jgi:predicted membrane-bound dolichyl-phosphate-mannose-protein mannosyltransferase
MNKNLIIGILLVLLLGNFLYRIWSYRENYLTPFDEKYWENKYLKSQWVIPNSKEGLGDDGLYAYAGYKYIHGADPTSINPEMPPLGKYLIGITITLFGNQAVFALVTGIATLVLLYFLSLSILKSKLLALVTVTFFSFEPLFYTQLSAPYLDLLYLSFLLAFMFFLVRKKLTSAAIVLGLFISTKNTASSLALGVLLSITYLFLNDRKSLKKWILYLPLSLSVLCLTYTHYFLLGHTFRDFLGVQKWIYLFYASGAKASFASFIPMLFTGIWHTWWGIIQRISEWNIMWPITAIITIIWNLYLLFKKQFNEIIIVTLWLLFYSIFLLFVPVWPRYFLLLIPFLYISTIHLVLKQRR